MGMQIANIFRAATFSLRFVDGRYTKEKLIERFLK